jgi:hypothetical protein
MTSSKLQHCKPDPTAFAQQIVKERQEVLKKAYDKNPDRFKRGVPTPLTFPQAVWINPPHRVSESVLQ